MIEILVSIDELNVEYPVVCVMSTCIEPLTIPAGFPTKFSQVAPATDALIEVAIEPLNVE
jgi:hypothetical protein